MRVLWIVDHLGYGGTIHGAGKYYYNTIPKLIEMGIDVSLSILRGRDQLTSLFEEIGIPHIHLNRKKFDPRTLWDVIREIRKRKIDLLHTHGYGSANFGRIAGMICGIPVIVHAHDHDTNYPFYQKIADFFLRLFTHRVVAISNSVACASRDVRGFSKDRIKVIYNGIHLDVFGKRDCDDQLKFSLGIPENIPIIGTIARLREEKGVRFFLLSIPRVLEYQPDAVFFVVGDGPLRLELESLVQQLEVTSKVLFLGFRTDISSLLRIMNIVVISSLTEGLSLVALEAMAAERPIIATRVGGIPEILNDGQTGILIPPADPCALADKILWLLNNPEESRVLAKRALRKSCSYDICFHTEKLICEYHRVVESFYGSKGIGR